VSARARFVAAALALGLAPWLAAPAAAQTKAGTSFGQFLLIEPGARIAAMGNAGATLGDGLQSVYYNPGAIGQLQAMEIDFSHAEWFAGIRYDHVAAGMPLGRWGQGYASLTSLNSGEIDVRTVEQPLGTGERYSVSDLSLALGWGMQVTDRVAAGLQVSWVQEKIWNSTANAFTFSLGTLYRVSPNGLRLGASLSNFGTEAGFDGRDLRITYDNDPDRTGDNSSLPGERFTGEYPVPILFRIGISMPYRYGPRWKTLLAADAAHPSDDGESVSLGGELEYRDVVALRAGYQSLFLEDSELGFTAGAGFRGRLETFNYRLDYGWADQGRLEATHRFTLGVTFR
jgi:hypothetical protein